MLFCGCIPTKCLWMSILQYYYYQQCKDIPVLSHEVNRAIIIDKRLNWNLHSIHIKNWNVYNILLISRTLVLFIKLGIYVYFNDSTKLPVLHNIWTKLYSIIEFIHFSLYCSLIFVLSFFLFPPHALSQALQQHCCYAHRYRNKITQYINLYS